MNDLIIIGGGAAGLFAGVCAGEGGLSCILLERRHRPGLKLLMCGNNRCNISHACDAPQMLSHYGEPISAFLGEAIREFSPDVLRKWFGKHGLQTAIHGERIYPKSEDADDVLHCFTDNLRDLNVPLSLNSAVQSVRKLPKEGFLVKLENNLNLEARNVLLATGGLSYPKTGSVGDGHRIASELGLRVTEARAGLAGVEHQNRWLTTKQNSDIPDVEVTALRGETVLAKTRGNVLCAGTVLRGSAIFDIVRLLAHQGITSDFSLVFDLAPNLRLAELRQRLKSSNLERVLREFSLPEENAKNLAEAIRRNQIEDTASLLKAIPVPVTKVRPLKEAIVTVGGVALDEIDPATMQSRKVRGLYFAGELLDIDGPTGGFNLHAAFATARLAVRNIWKETQYAKHHRS